MLYHKVQLTAKQLKDWNEKLQNDEILVREIIDIDTNYMEDDEKHAETKKDDENKDEINNDGKKIRMKMMNLILLLLQWKKKLNQKF